MSAWFKKYWKVLAGAGILALASLAASLLPLADWIKQFSSWVETLGSLGVLVFILVYALATVLFVPGSLMTIAAGLVFDLGLGTLAAWCGAVLGSSLAFLAGRHLARDFIERKTKGDRKFKAIDEAVAERGPKLIALLRLSPLIPFNIANYFYGVTKIGFWPYVGASAVGMLPGTVLYVYLGAVGKAGLGGSRGSGRSPYEYVFFALGLVATIAVSIWVSRIAKKALHSVGAGTQSKRHADASGRKKGGARAKKKTARSHTKKR